MTDHMEHAQVSELLAEYVAGRLAEHEARAVAAHLRDCLECAQEHSAVIALRAPEPDPLTETERIELRAAVAAAVRAPADATVISPSHRSWQQRLWPALGAAAVLALVVGGLTLYSGGDDSPPSRAPHELEQGAERFNAPAADEDAPDGSDAAGATGGGGATTEALTVSDAALFEPEIGRIRAGYLKGLGRGSETFAASRTKKRTGAQESVAALADQAGEHGDQVRACGDVVAGQDPNATAVYGATGTYSGKPVLVIGFAGSGSKGNRFSFWIWRLGNCDELVDTLFGTTRR